MVSKTFDVSSILTAPVHKKTFSLIAKGFLFYLLKLRTSKITVHLENSIENATKVSHQAAFSLAFKVSGIASRNLSTKSDISCSEIVKNSLA